MSETTVPVGGKRLRVRGPNIGTIMSEAGKRGLRMKTVTVKPGGVIELNFTREVEPPPIVNDLEPPEAA